MVSRDDSEDHRASTPLELLFDLVFVAAVAQAGQGLHHALAEGRFADGLIGYAMIFFAIWWAWMNFTWFASAYDTDDVPYRLAVFVQMAGALVLAAGVPRALEHRDFAIGTLGYVIMRVAAVPQWLRASHGDRARRASCRRYAAGVTVVQIAWVARLGLHGVWATVGFVVFGVAELLVPVIAERPARTPWHPGHIAERYGLFTLIVLGESILAASGAVQSALDAKAGFTTLITTAAGGLLIVFSMWWIYFAKPAERLFTSLRFSMVWGYGHYFIFAAAAAVGAGLTLSVDHAVAGTHVSDRVAALAVTVPVAVYLIAVWVLHLRPHHIAFWHAAVFPIAAALALAASFTPQPVLVTGLVMALTLSVSIVIATRTLPASTP